MFRFEDIYAWQKAHAFVLLVYRVTGHFPEVERFGLISQFRRAAVSIEANIAEGYKKLSKADKLRFFNISQGSLEECRDYIILSRDLNFLQKGEFEAWQVIRLLLWDCDPLTMPVTARVRVCR